VSRTYYFNIIDGNRAHIDGEGEAFADPAEAIARASHLIEELLRELGASTPVVVEVTDEHGQRVAGLPHKP